MILSTKKYHSNGIGDWTLRICAIAGFFWSTCQAQDLTDGPVAEVLASHDILSAKMMVDALIEAEDPSEDVLKTVNSFTESARAMLPESASEWDRIQAAQRVLYEPGPWNDHRPFSYDHNDPLGTKIENKLLSNYLETRLGNCVSMPTLYAIVLEQLGVPVTLRQAPVHSFVIWTDSDTGMSINLEATSGGHPARNEWYQQNSIITPEAMENGLYLRPLSIRERNATIASTYVEHLMAAGEFDEARRIIDLVLEAHPAFAAMLITRANTYYGEMQRDFVSQWPDANDVPEDRRPELQRLINENNRYSQRAFEMGWRLQPPPPEQAKQQ